MWTVELVLVVLYILEAELWVIDDVLWINFAEAILNEAFRSPDHKTFLGWMGKTAGQSESPEGILE